MIALQHNTIETTARLHRLARRSDPTLDAWSPEADELRMMDREQVTVRCFTALARACDIMIRRPVLERNDPLLDPFDQLVRWLPALAVEPDGHDRAWQRVADAITMIDQEHNNCGPIQGGSARVARAFDRPLHAILPICLPHIMRLLLREQGSHLHRRYATMAEHCGFLGTTLIATARRLVQELIEVRDALDLPGSLRDLDIDRASFNGFVKRLGDSDPLKTMLPLAWQRPRMHR